MNDRKRRKDRKRRGVRIPCIMCGKAKRGKIVGSSTKERQNMILRARVRDAFAEA